MLLHCIKDQMKVARETQEDPAHTISTHGSPACAEDPYKGLPSEDAHEGFLTRQSCSSSDVRLLKTLASTTNLERVVVTRVNLGVVFPVGPGQQCELRNVKGDTPAVARWMPQRVLPTRKSSKLHQSSTFERMGSPEWSSKKKTMVSHKMDFHVLVTDGDSLFSSSQHCVAIVV